MQKALEHLLHLLESPYIEKTYKELRDFYQSEGMQNEADAFTVLIEKRFHAADNADSGKK